jgi:hypothetical protein
MIGLCATVVPMLSCEQVAQRAREHVAANMHLDPRSVPHNPSTWERLN